MKLSPLLLSFFPLSSPLPPPSNLDFYFSHLSLSLSLPLALILLKGSEPLVFIVATYSDLVSYFRSPVQTFACTSSLPPPSTAVASSASLLVLLHDSSLYLPISHVGECECVSSLGFPFIFLHVLKTPFSTHTCPCFLICFPAYPHPSLKPWSLCEFLSTITRSHAVKPDESEYLGNGNSGEF